MLYLLRGEAFEVDQRRLGLGGLERPVAEKHVVDGLAELLAVARVRKVVVVVAAAATREAGHGKGGGQSKSRSRSRSRGR